MIAYVEGRLGEIRDNACVLLTDGGIGYEIFLPARTLAALPAAGERFSLYTFLVVREDAQELYGFETWDERLTFGILLSISKVGARTALSILSTFKPDDLRHIVLEDEPLALTRVSGIGKKTAQHIFLELKYKIRTDSISNTTPSNVIRPGSVYHDALSALAGLGYGEEETGALLKSILHEEPDLDVSGALRAALKALAKGR